MAEGPGVRFEETAQRAQVTFAGAALAAFVGQARRGRTDKTGLVSSWADFVAQYGGFNTASDLGQYLWDFFRNGGAQARILRIVGGGAAGASNTTQLLDKAGNVAMTAYAANEGDWGNTLALTTKQYELVVTGAAFVIDSDDYDLPNTGDNAASSNTGRLVVNTLIGVSLGDILDGINPATGAYVASGPIMVVGMDAESNSIYYINTAGDFTANMPAGAILRSASMHRARTFLTAELAINATFADFSSVEGISKGSLLTFAIFSHCQSLASRGYAKRTQAIVDRLVGKRVYFVAATDNGAAIPATTSAFYRYIASGDDGIDFTANAAGPGGNSVSVSITLGAANSIEVLGRHIKITRLDWETDDLIAAIEANAAATSLVSVAAVNDPVAVTALAQVFLTGGAQLQAVSQEFGVQILEDGIEVEKGQHTYLSTINTSKDYFRTRLGGTLVPLAASDVNPSRRIILLGGDGDIDTAANELPQLPRALSNIGLTGGDDGNSLTDDDLIGVANPRAGIHILSAHDDIDFAAAPGFTSAVFQIAAAAYAEARGDMEWLLDVPEDSDSAEAMNLHRQVDLGLDNSYIQLFGPWGVINDPRPTQPRNSPLYVPPSPMVMGLITKAISAGGPIASVGNQQPVSWIGLKVNVTEAEHADLNENGVSVIRLVSRRGIRVYGDRTLLQTAESRRFGNVRRWLSYFKQSVRVSLTPLLFQTINTSLFGNIEAAVRAFLESEWRKGALYPQSSMEQAFFVKCDGETTTAQDIANAEVVCEVGVSPAVPAEKILFRLNTSTGGVRFQEN